MDVGWLHAVLQKISSLINEKMALATLDLFAAVIAAPSAISEVLTKSLSMIAAVGWGLRPIVRRELSRRPKPRVRMCHPRAIGHSFVKDGATRWILVRQQPALCPGAQQTEHRIGDAPEGIGLPPSGGMAARDKGLEQPASAAAQLQTYVELTTCIEQ
jgi:hypothetical protein